MTPIAISLGSNRARFARCNPRVVDIPSKVDPALSYIHHFHDECSHLSKSAVNATCITWHPTGASFAVGCNHGVVLVFSIETMHKAATPQLVHTIVTGDSSVETCTYSACGSLLAVCHISGMVGIFEACFGGQLVLTLEYAMPPHMAAASKYRTARSFHASQCLSLLMIAIHVCSKVGELHVGVQHAPCVDDIVPKRPRVTQSDHHAV